MIRRHGVAGFGNRSMIGRSVLLACLVVLVGSTSISGQEDPTLPAAAKLEKLWSEGSFTEGPAYGPGGCVYFSDIGNRIMKFAPAPGKTTVYREPSGRANGLDF